MRVVRWRKADTGVESFTITATGVYFPVGKTDSSFKLKLRMAAGGQTAAVDTVRDATGTRTGYGAMNVSGTTETKLGAVVSLATGIIVTAISGTLTPILDDEIAITTWPEWGIGSFPAKEDVEAYVYGSNPPVGLTATVSGTPYTWKGAAVGWVASGFDKIIRRDSSLYGGGDVTVTINQTVQTGRIVSLGSPECPAFGCNSVGFSGDGNWNIFDAPGFFGFEIHTASTYVAVNAQCAGDGLLKKYQIFIDGKPVYAAPQADGVASVGQGQLHCYNIAFSTGKRRRITVFISGMAQAQVIVSATSSCSAIEQKPVILVVGDSFSDGATSAYKGDSIVGNLQMALDANVLSVAEGGAGWVALSGSTNQPFGAVAKIARITYTKNISKIIFIGSVNDDGLSGIDSAVQSTISSYKIAFPSADILVLGPQPSSATATLSENRKANNRAVHSGCISSGVKFIDLIGNAVYDGYAFSGSTTPAVGDLILAEGSIWEFRGPYGLVFSSLPPYNANTRLHFRCVTALLWGTGRASSPAGSGSRDALLAADAKHPTADIGFQEWGELAAAHLIDAK